MKNWLNAAKSSTKKIFINRWWNPGSGNNATGFILPYRTWNKHPWFRVGEKSWKKGFKVKNCVGANADDKTGYVYANDIIYKVDFVQGDINEWVKNVTLESKEVPSSLQILDNDEMSGFKF